MTSSTKRSMRGNPSELLKALQARAGKDTTLAELASASGFAAETLKTYISKNMLVGYLDKVSRRAYRVAPEISPSVGELRRCLSQRTNRYTWEHLGVTELVSSLLDRSRTNAGLALELINRPEMANRLDAFVLLFVTAWEQLLKAKLEHQKPRSIFIGKKNATGREFTITLSTALERVFPSSNDPVRRNIEKLKELRDGAAHLVVQEVIGVASRYFQAAILNYISQFQSVAEEPPFRFEGTGLLTLGIAYQSPRLEVLRVRHGDSAGEVKALIDQLEKGAQADADPQFAVAIDYKLYLDKNPGPNAIKLSKAEEGTPVVIVKDPRDPKVLYPYTTKQVAEQLKQRGPAHTAWNLSSVAIVADYLDVKVKDNQYHYVFVSGTSTIHTYSEDFIEMVLDEIRKSPDLVSKAYQAAKEKRSKRSNRAKSA